MKSWVIQSFLTFDSMDRTLKCDHSLKAVGQYFAMVLLWCFGLGNSRSKRVDDALLVLFLSLLQCHQVAQHCQIPVEDCNLTVESLLVRERLIHRNEQSWLCLLFKVTNTLALNPFKPQYQIINSLFSSPYIS